MISAVLSKKQHLAVWLISCQVSKSTCFTVVPHFLFDLVFYVCKEDFLQEVLH